MNFFARTTASVAVTFLVSGTLARADELDVDKAAIRAQLLSYQHALNTSDIDAVPPLYTPDGIFMAPFSPSAIGSAATRKAYEAVFKAIKFDVKFNVAELVEMSPEWAFARTNSAGVSTSPVTGKRSTEANQELFIFRKVDGTWKIARYSFSPIDPPQH